MNTYEKKLEEFRLLCQAHDLFYEHSDDFSVWKAGDKTYTQICDEAAKFKTEDADRIWNEVVDSKCPVEVRDYFYWKDY